MWKNLDMKDDIVAKLKAILPNPSDALPYLVRAEWLTTIVGKGDVT